MKSRYIVKVEIGPPTDVLLVPLPVAEMATGRKLNLPEVTTLFVYEIPVTIMLDSWTLEFHYEVLSGQNHQGKWKHTIRIEDEIMGGTEEILDPPRSDVLDLTGSLAEELSSIPVRTLLSILAFHADARAMVAATEVGGRGRYASRLIRQAVGSGSTLDIHAVY